MTKERWIDITTTITNGMVTWPGDVPVKISRNKAIGVNDSLANVTGIKMSAHTGTHIDAPLHFIDKGKDITEIRLDNLIGPAKVLHITDPHQIRFTELKELNIEKGDRLLFRTINSEKNWSRQAFMNDYIHLSTNAAQYLVKLGVRTIGVDYLSVAGKENGAEVHQLLLKAGITIIEGLQMKNIVPGHYEMIALPMKIKDADGAPARVLIRKYAEADSPSIQVPE